MEPEYPRSPWYDQSLPAVKPGKKRHRALKITALVLCALVVIAAGVFAFVPGLWPWHGTAAGADNNLLPDYPEDYRDYLSAYYQAKSASSAEKCLLPRLELDTDFRLELQSAEDHPELTLQELYARCINSVVSIYALEADSISRAHTGTGFIVSPDGFIVTNQHIIAGCDSVTVTLGDGNIYEAFLMGEDTQTDIAVLKIVAANLPAVELGESSALQVGDSVAAIGNPLGQNLTGTLTDGIISAIDRSIRANGRTMTLLQTTAALNEGNSGGPLFNQYGQVVGITNMKMVNAYSSVSVEGIGFAIPTATVKTITDQIFASGHYSRPGLGITLGAVPADAAAYYGIPQGLFVSDISEYSSAQEAGIQVGDIVTHANGTQVHRTDEVLSIRDGLAVGDSMTLTIYREGETLELSIVIGDLGQLY